MSTDPMNFRLDPSDYLGHEHEQFKQTLMELALSEPKKYFELRKDVLRCVKTQAVNDVYATYYHMLTEGLNKDESNRLLSNPGGAVLASDSYIRGGFRPNIPRQKVNEFALKAAKTLDAISEEAVEMILPADYRTIAENRQVQKTAGNLGII
jgi:hypothetical protein